jgi:hypothetical protein
MYRFRELMVYVRADADYVRFPATELNGLSRMKHANNQPVSATNHCAQAMYFRLAVRDCAPERYCMISDQNRIDVLPGKDELWTNAFPALALYSF